MILVLGGNGYVGSAFSRVLQSRGSPFLRVSRAEIDYTIKDRLSELLRDTRPELVINCAGYTGRPNVDACERDRANCLAGNSILPGIIREACEDHEIPWGHVSSGCIYSGERPGGGGWREDDAPNFSFRKLPCSFYSGTKALGEEVLGWNEANTNDFAQWPGWVNEDGASGYVWRLRIPFDEVDCRRNYLTKLQRYEILLEARNSLSQLSDFVNACLDCWQKRVPFGIYNVTNPGSVLTSEVVELIRSKEILDKEFRFFSSEEEFYQLAAKTPRSNCVLDSSKLLDAGVEMRSVHDALDWSLDNWAKEVVER